ncbi:hypothetical protein SAMN04487819_10698 [Actinopolyspora alba]|uniref:DUF6194 domain-containing protein n=1 Tax=Actinopolyspora alba TaxID=673379 RepID=A0A1I1WTK7_9ACTN|nr:DUF6194 family protein [Actinopolyspora alba]SFD98456.1 hypothetical protein SAMN04487819_10698 [Actinopolyspora alba]
MSMERILSEIRTYDGVLELASLPGSEHPEISWGDHFFYYAPDGQVPRNRQPYATIVTKNYPDDTDSHLDAADRWRLNLHVGARAFTELIGHAPNETDAPRVDHSVEDVFRPHPLYGAFGWVCVVNPGTSTLERALEALRDAHLADRRRVERRQSRNDSTLNG